MSYLWKGRRAMWPIVYDASFGLAYGSEEADFLPIRYRHERNEGWHLGFLESNRP